MDSENLIGVLLFFFVALGGFLKIVDAVDYVSDQLVVRAVQLVSLLVLISAIFVLLRFEAYSS